MEPTESRVCCPSCCRSHQRYATGSGSTAGDRCFPAALKRWGKGVSQHSSLVQGTNPVCTKKCKEAAGDEFLRSVR